MSKKKNIKDVALDDMNELMNEDEARDELNAMREARRYQKSASEKSRQNKKLLDQMEEMSQALDIALDLRQDTEKYRPIRIKTREKGVVKEGTAVLLFSDIHPEEVVLPETVANLNEFNPDIARERIESLIVGTRWYLEAVRANKGKAGYKIRDFVLALLGDLISNTIHPDLAESNALGPADAVNFVFDLIQTVIDALLEDKELEQIIIPCVMGNHDRMTPKNRHQTKAETSLATIIYANLRRLYRDEPRIKFDIARGSLLYTEIYGKTVRWTHGDDIRYGGGVGGITIPVRKAIDSWNKSVDAELTCFGHWHQLMYHQDFVCNGSVIGYGPFAQAIKARFEPAAQAFFILDPERGKRFCSPVQLQECDHHWS